MIIHVLDSFIGDNDYWGYDNYNISYWSSRTIGQQSRKSTAFDDPDRSGTSYQQGLVYVQTKDSLPNRYDIHVFSNHSQYDFGKYNFLTLISRSKVKV